MEDLSEYEPLRGSQQAPMPGAQATGLTDAHEDIEVMVKLRRKQPLPDPSRVRTAPVTREQLADEYGASQEDIDAVVGTYTLLGLTNSFVDAATRTLKFAGPVAAMEKAFKVQLYNYSSAGAVYRGRTGYVYIPKRLSKIVEAVFGLDDPPVRHRVV